MSGRTTLKGNAMLGGRVEFRGDLPNFLAANARQSGLTDRLTVPATTARTRSAVVDRHPRMAGFNNFYSHGAVQMQRPIPGQPGYTQVYNSAFQRYNIRLLFWQIITSWGAAGMPRNLGLSTAVPQPETNATGGPGQSMMTQRGLFTRVQTVGRPRAVVQRYDTRSSNR